MGFRVPDMPLTCNIYTVSSSSYVFRLDSPCNLAMGKRELVLIGAGEPSNVYSTLFAATAQLLLPAGTDIRDVSCGGYSDIVEVPAGSGRFYGVMGVDDLGKGFDNEHRMALMFKTWGFAGNPFGLPTAWPTPIP